MARHEICKTTDADLPLDVYNSRSLERFGLCTVFDKLTKSAAASMKHNTLKRSLAIKGCSAYELTTRGFGFCPRTFGVEMVSAGALAFCPDTLLVAVGLTEVLWFCPDASSIALGLTGILMNCLISIDGSLFT